MLNPANLITSVRIFLLPVALFFFMKNDLRSNIISLVLVILMELSDMFDGQVARRLNRVSNLGKIFDPFADHIYRISFFLFFSIKGFIPLWMFLLCFYRDSIVMNLRIFAASQENTFVAARQSGKLKAEAQSTGIILFILLQIVNFKFPIINLDKIYYMIMFIVTAVTLWSAFDYLLGILKRSRKYLNTACLSVSILVLFFIIIHSGYHRVIFQPSNVFAWKEQTSLKKILPGYIPQAISGDGHRLYLTFTRSNAPSLLAIFSIRRPTLLTKFEFPGTVNKLSGMDYFEHKLWLIDGQNGKLITVDIARSIETGSLEIADEIDTGIEGASGLAFISYHGRTYMALSVFLKGGETYLIDYSQALKGTGFAKSIRYTIKNYNFSQGLAFDGRNLYDANSFFGFDRIFKIDIDKAIANESYNGAVVEVFNSPDQMIKDIYIYENEIWTTDEYTLKLYKGILKK